MKLLEIRTGCNEPPSFYQNILPHWPEETYSSSYLKNVVDSVEANISGLAGNEIGYPTHIDNAHFRSAMVQNELIWQEFEKVIPGSSEHMKRGSFGENFTVNHPDLLPSVVCVGDEYRIGTALFRVTGPRMPCPKVDAFIGVKGLTALGRKTAWTGYFFQVIEPGVCSKGDTIELMNRPYPGYDMTRIARGLWGDEADQDKSEEFLRALSGMECLMTRHFRDTATQRLERLLAAKSESS